MGSSSLIQHSKFNIQHTPRVMRWQWIALICCAAAAAQTQPSVEQIRAKLAERATQIKNLQLTLVAQDWPYQPAGEVIVKYAAQPPNRYRLEVAPGNRLEISDATTRWEVAGKLVKRSSVKQAATEKPKPSALTGLDLDLLTGQDPFASWQARLAGSDRLGDRDCYLLELNRPIPARQVIEELDVTHPRLFIKTEPARPGPRARVWVDKEQWIIRKAQWLPYSESGEEGHTLEVKTTQTTNGIILPAMIEVTFLRLRKQPYSAQVREVMANQVEEEVAFRYTPAADAVVSDQDLSVRDCERLLKDKPDDAGLWYRLAEAAQFTDEKMQWLAAARRVTALQPKLSDGWRMLARALDSLGRYPEETKALQTAITLEPQAADLYEQQARAFLRMRDLKAAGDAYQKAVELRLKTQTASWTVTTPCWLLERQGKREAALDLAKRWLTAMTPTSDYREARSLLDWAQQTDLLAELAKAITAARAKDPDSVALALTDLYASAKLGQADAAARIADDLLAREALSSMTAVEVGSSLLDLGRNAEAEKVLRSALNAAQNRFDLMVVLPGLLKTLSAAGRSREALALLATRAADPQSDLSVYEVSEALALSGAVGQTEVQAQWLALARQLDPAQTDLASARLLARALGGIQATREVSSADLTKETERWYSRVLELAPNSAEDWAGLGSWRTERQDSYQAGIEALERAVAAAPNDPAYLGRLGGLLLQARQNAHACEVAKQLTEEFPDQGLALLMAATVYPNCGDAQPRAAEVLSKAITLFKPADWARLDQDLEAAAHLWLGDAYETLKQLPQAEEQYRIGLELAAPWHRSEASRRLMALLVKASKWDQLLQFCKQQIGQARDDRQAAAEVTDLVSGANRQELAKRALADLAQHPDDGLAQLAGAFMLEALDNRVDALAAARRATELLPDDPRAWSERATLAVNPHETTEPTREAYAEVVLACEKGLALTPADSDLARQYVEALSKTDQQQKALAFVESFASVARWPHDWQFAARLYSTAGAMDRALKCYDEIERLAKTPEAIWNARLQLANLFRQQGQETEALQRYQQILADAPDIEPRCSALEEVVGYYRKTDKLDQARAAVQDYLNHTQDASLRARAEQLLKELEPRT